MKAKKFQKMLLFSVCTAFVISFSSLDALSQEKTLVLGLGGEPHTLFPIDTSLLVQNRVFNICEPLVSLDADAKPIPVLATSWEIVEGYKWRFHLRKGVEFHSGDKFTAKDVAFSIDFTKDPKNQNSRMFLVKDYTYKIIDDYTIDIFNEKGVIDPVLPTRWWPIRILPIKTFEKMGFKEFSVGPVGTGPFQFVKWERGSQLILEAFDKYWGGKPKIRKLIYMTVAEPAARIAGLKRGELDIAVEIPPTEVKSIEADPSLEIKKKRSLNAQMAFLRCDIPPFKDNINLRKAVVHAIDSKALIEKILGGFGLLEGSVVPPDAFGYNSKIQPHKYDPELAKKYLKDSGYKGEEVGICVSNGRYVMDLEMNLAMAGYLRAIGINAKPNIYDWPSWVGRYRARTIEPILYTVWNCSSGDGSENINNTAHKSSSGAWLSGEFSESVSKIIEVALTNPDAKVRRETIERVSQMLHDYYYFALNFTPIDVYGVRKGVKWVPRADGGTWMGPDNDKL
jgi:peptide/nickel transport system substrate-binding protein